MTNFELTLLREAYIDSTFFSIIPETPDGNFEELALAALDYADEMKTEAERINELHDGMLEKAQELKSLVNRLVNFLKDSPNEADCTKRVTEVEIELLDYKEI